MDTNTAKIVDFPLTPTALNQVLMTTGRVSTLQPGELIATLDEDARLVRCEILISAGGISLDLTLGDKVLVGVTHDSPAGWRGVVLGRIAPYGEQRLASRVVVSASEGVEIRCGEASVDLRADGKVMIRGEDVLVRAKGTQRIRAGTVAIN